MTIVAPKMWVLGSIRQPQSPLSSGVLRRTDIERVVCHT